MYLSSNAKTAYMKCYWIEVLPIVVSFYKVLEIFVTCFVELFLECLFFLIFDSPFLVNKISEFADSSF